MSKKQRTKTAPTEAKTTATPILARMEWGRNLCDIDFILRLKSEAHALIDEQLDEEFNEFTNKFFSGYQRWCNENPHAPPGARFKMTFGLGITLSCSGASVVEISSKSSYSVRRSRVTEPVDVQLELPGIEEKKAAP